MPAYATAAEFDAYSDLAVGAGAIDQLLERASRDVDTVLGPLPTRRADPFRGFKLDPATDLDLVGREALSRATCAQAEHRQRNPELYTGERLAASVKGPDFEESYSVTGDATRTRIAPAVRDELRPLSYLRPVGARARA